MENSYKYISIRGVNYLGGIMDNGEMRIDSISNRRSNSDFSRYPLSAKFNNFKRRYVSFRYIIKDGR